MKVVPYISGGHSFNIAVPETVEEFDSLAKKQGACLEAAIDHEVYHGTLGDVRDAFASLVEEVHGIKRRELGTGVFEGEGEARAEVTKTEKNDVFLARVAAEKGLTGEAPFADIAKRLSAGGDKEVKFNPAPRERKAPKPATLPKWATEQATAFLATADDNKVKKFIAFALKMANVTLEKTGNNEVDVKAFASAAVEIKKAQNVFGN